MIVYKELSTLVRDLGYSARTLYGVSNRIGKHYHPVAIPKPGGGTRTLQIPDGLLKAIQRRICEVLLAPEPVSPWATAYRPGCGAGINAALHVGRPLLLKLDILHFFDSVGYPLVKDRVFPAERFSEANRILLTILCTHREALPQGASTSPAISNIIMREFDETVGGWCAARGIAYTRYCDDMAFSGRFDPGPLTALVREELRKMGLFLNERKTALIRDGRRKTVTGLVVNEKAAVPAEYRRRLRQEMHYCMRYGVDSHLERLGLDCPAREYIPKLLGRVNYVLSVTPDDPEFLAYGKWLKGLPRKEGAQRFRTAGQERGGGQDRVKPS